MTRSQVFHRINTFAHVWTMFAHLKHGMRVFFVHFFRYEICIFLFLYYVFLFVIVYFCILYLWTYGWRGMRNCCSVRKVMVHTSIVCLVAKVYLKKWVFVCNFIFYVLGFWICCICQLEELEVLCKRDIICFKCCK